MYGWAKSKDNQIRLCKQLAAHSIGAVQYTACELMRLVPTVGRSHQTQSETNAMNISTCITTADAIYLFFVILLHGIVA